MPIVLGGVALSENITPLRLGAGLSSDAHLSAARLTLRERGTISTLFAGEIRLSQVLKDFAAIAGSGDVAGLVRDRGAVIEDPSGLLASPEGGVGLAEK